MASQLPKLNLTPALHALSRKRLMERLRSNANGVGLLESGQAELICPASAELKPPLSNLSKEAKDKSMDSINTVDSEYSYESNNYSSAINYGELKDDLDPLSGHFPNHNTHCPHSHHHHHQQQHRPAGSSGIGSEQSTSYESSEAEESAADDRIIDEVLNVDDADDTGDDEDDDHHRVADDEDDDDKERLECSSDTSDYSDDDSQLEQLRQIKRFMKNFVHQIFTNSMNINVEKKATFGEYCRTETGRLWFARYINKQRVQQQQVSETTFFSLIQYFAIILFECSDADDFSPAKVIMNMCFTFYYNNRRYNHCSSNNSKQQQQQQQSSSKQYLYQYLREQPIWRSLRFWNAAFFDAVQCERKKRPALTRNELNYYSDEEMDDENKYQQNITFGQLVTFTHNMKEFGLQREQCLDFLHKQCSIASLPKEQILLLQQNLNQMYAFSDHIKN